LSFNITTLQSRLQKPLPGKEAQIRMSAFPKDLERFVVKERPDAKLGAVLILLYLHEGEWFIPLMKRPDYEGVHGGQISFPGGKKEELDSDLFATALREAEEEVGVKPETVNVIGSLSELYIPPSNFKVFPVIAYSNQRPEFYKNQYEVEKILEMPIRQLMEPSTVKQTTIKVMGGLSLPTPYFDVDGEIVWGATAMILSELKEIINQI